MFTVFMLLMIRLKNSRFVDDEDELKELKE